MRQNFACGVEKNSRQDAQLSSLIFIFSRNFYPGEPGSNVKSQQKFLRTLRKMSHPTVHLAGDAPNIKLQYKFFSLLNIYPPITGKGSMRYTSSLRSCRPSVYHTMMGESR